MEAGGEEVVVVSLVENRARETCIVRLSTNNLSEAEVYLVADSHSYSETISTLQLLDPQEILLHDGRKNSVLSKKVEMHFGNAACAANPTRVVYISRQYYDQDRGAEMLKRVLVGVVDSDLLSKYTVLGAAFCLLRYIENVNSFSFAKHSLRLHYRTATGNRCIIDRGTSSNLELVSNLRDGNQKESLFGLLNRCKTKVGARFLRAQILRPAADLQTLYTRHAVVELFVTESGLLQQSSKTLAKFPELDRMLSGLVAEPKTVTQTTVKLSIDTMIMLKTSILLANELAALLESSHVFQPGLAAAEATTTEQQQQQQQQFDSQRTRALVGAVLGALKEEGLVDITRLISSLLVDSTAYSKSTVEMRVQECFAVQPGVSGLLDVSRKTYLQSVEDIFAQGQRHGSELGRNVKVSFSTGRGYYLQIAHDDETGSEPLPDEFIQQVRNKKTISCSTRELTSLSDRASEAIGNALSITNSLLQDAMEQLREERAESLYAMIDAIALLDMLRAFAEVSSSSLPQLVRPDLTDDPHSPLIIQQGRHPFSSSLHAQQRVGSFVPNDSAVTPLLNFVLVSGANGSGKTTYIKQTALLIVMAQIGCFLPVRAATIPLRDRILSRMGSTDDMENNLSSFLNEMRDNAYILSHLTARSLVVIDELGRGTSNLDGMSLAFSVAEHLLASSAFTLFVSHYPTLSLLERMYPGVRNVHLESQMDVESHAGDSVRMLHRVKAGVSEVTSGYGIRMAAAMGFPPRVVSNARSIQIVIRQEFPELLETQQIDTSVARVAQTLAQLRLPASLDDSGLRVYLGELRSRLDSNATVGILRLLDELDAQDQKKKSSAPPTHAQRGQADLARVDEVVGSKRAATAAAAAEDDDVEHQHQSPSPPHHHQQQQQQHQQIPVRADEESAPADDRSSAAMLGLDDDDVLGRLLEDDDNHNHETTPERMNHEDEEQATGNNATAATAAAAAATRLEYDD